MKNRGKERVNSGVCQIILIMMVVLRVCVVTAFSQNDNIGGFDISKVRDATLGTDSVTDATSSLPVEREHVFSVVARVAFYLGIVVILIVLVAMFFRKKGLQGSGAGGAMDVIETLPMGTSRMMVMVRVMDEIYLLAHTASSVTLIDKIGGDKAVDIIASSKGGGTMLHFKDALNTFMGKMKKSV